MLEEIRNRHKQDEVEFNKVSKGLVHQDRGHLLSLIDHHITGWEVMSSISMHMHSSEIRDFAKKMLKGEKPYALNEE